MKKISSQTTYPVISKETLKQFSDLLFTNRELGITHNPYDQELQEMTSIEQGDLETLEQSLNESYSGEIGRLAKDDLRNAKNLAIVNAALKYEYALMVSEIKKMKTGKSAYEENYHVKRCKNYIFTHLHGKLTLAQIAHALSLNASYLSDLFHRSEGITVTAFIRKEKMNAAQNLLMYSDYSYSEIAAWLGFASQSHLGTQFKETVGMTMRQYKEMYGLAR